MTIEFIGLPGVGKSYICRRLFEVCEPPGGAEAIHVAPAAEDQRRVAHLAAKLHRATLFLLRHPLVTGRILHCVGRSAQKSSLEAVFKAVNLLSELQAVDRTQGVSVIDQGVLQAIWSVLLRGRNCQDERRFLELVRPWLPSVVIFVVAEREENIRRLRTRLNGQSRIDGLPAGEIEAELIRGTNLLEQIFKEWKEVVSDGRELRVVNQGDFSPSMVASLLPELLSREATLHQAVFADRRG
tara:strand:+ start:9082 stop:9804 length:723 start_codon:yes stop_codon:yes gene_type:complete